MWKKGDFQNLNKNQSNHDNGEEQSRGDAG